MSKTKIEWADTVWNPVTGCNKVSEGCRNCYAERMSKRLAGRCGYPKDDPFKVTLHPDKLEDPMKWVKSRRIFVNSMSDLFHDDVPNEFILKVFNVMANAQWIRGHKFMVLTKRPERMKRIIEAIKNDLEEQAKPEKLPNGMTRHKMTFSFPLQNIWLGVSVENQAAAEERIPLLLQTPAAVRFISVEPLLGQLEISKYLTRTAPTSYSLLSKFYGPMGFDETGSQKEKVKIQGLDWVICGGETGPGARPMHPDWARSLRDQCQAANVPFFFKSWGEHVQVGVCMNEDDDDKYYDDSSAYDNVKRINLEGGAGYHGPKSIYMQRVGKKKAGRLLDGRTWEEFPWERR